MFYYPNVLQRHTGCFSTIWLAATRGIRVTRRDLLKVQVSQTCSDILDYVTARVPPPQPHLPRPRFSLYLSSQLQYGVVIVFHRQCGFVLEEAQQTIERLLRAKTCIHIDMAETDRRILDVPDGLYVMEEAEGAQDPFFGLMQLDQLPSPYKIQQAEFVIKEPGPRATVDKEGFRSPPGAITLTESEQFAVTAAEDFEGDDLPEATAREIDLLMDQPDQFSREVEEMRAEEKIRECEGQMTSIDQLKETEVGAEQESAFVPDVESGQPAWVPLTAGELEVTPRVSMPAPPYAASGREGSPTSERSHGEQVIVRPPGKPAGGRRRQLVFADPRVQIPNRTMMDQVGNPLAETRNLSEVLLDLPASAKRQTPAQLFSASCGSLFNADLQSLWKQCAFLAVSSEDGEEQGGKEEDIVQSEQDREILRTERRRRRHSGMKEISSESELQPADGSSALGSILDAFKEDKSTSDVLTPVSRWSPQEEAQPPMEPIAEENIEMPEAQTETTDMLSWVSSNLQQFGAVTFDSLLPPEADRSTAANTIYKLLVLLSAGRVTAHQGEPYSDITIKPPGVRTTA